MNVALEPNARESPLFMRIPFKRRTIDPRCFPQGCRVLRRKVGSPSTTPRIPIALGMPIRHPMQARSSDWKRGMPGAPSIQRRSFSLHGQGDPVTARGDARVRRGHRRLGARWWQQRSVLGRNEAHRGRERRVGGRIRVDKMWDTNLPHSRNTLTGHLSCGPHAIRREPLAPHSPSSLSSCASRPRTAASMVRARVGAA